MKYSQDHLWGNFRYKTPVDTPKRDKKNSEGESHCKYVGLPAFPWSVSWLSV